MIERPRSLLIQSHNVHESGQQATVSQRIESSYPECAGRIKLVVEDAAIRNITVSELIRNVQQLRLRLACEQLNIASDLY